MILGVGHMWEQFLINMFEISRYNPSQGRKLLYNFSIYSLYLILLRVQAK